MATLSSNSFEIQILAASGLPAMPSYASSMTVNEWYYLGGPSPALSLSGTNLGTGVSYTLNDNGNSGFQSYWIAWNSAVFSPDLGSAGSYLLWGGGHNDWFGNAILRWDIETRTWSRLTEAYSPIPARTTTLDSGRYADGTPSPPHTYLHLEYLNGQMICTKSIDDVGSPSTGSSSRARPHIYDVAADEWRIGPLLGSITAESSGTSAVDTTREGIWLIEFSSGNLAFFDPAGDNGNGTYGNWTFYDLPSGNYNNRGALIHDPVTDKLIVFEATSSEIWSIDASNPTAGRSVVSFSGTLGSPDDQSAYDWSDALGGIVHKPSTANANTYLLKTTNDWASGVWTTISSTGNGNNFSNTNGIQQRCRLCKFSDGEMLIFSGEEDTPVLGMRIS